VTNLENFIPARRKTLKDTVKKIVSELENLGNKEIAEHSQRFFRTGTGEYGEGDRFLGIRVPVLRRLAKGYGTIDLDDAFGLLMSPFHEARLLALLILIIKYSKEDDKNRRLIYRGYLANTKSINNWDLVDCSAEHIIGAHLFTKKRYPIYKLAESKSLWERRIAIISTFYFIRRNDYSDTMAIAKILLCDREDLIHKAVGWMLREVGKRDIKKEETFLDRHHMKMPRTMLRYAIEKFPEQKRQYYLRL